MQVTFGLSVSAIYHGWDIQLSCQLGGDSQLSRQLGGDIQLWRIQLYRTTLLAISQKITVFIEKNKLYSNEETKSERQIVG